VPKTDAEFDQWEDRAYAHEDDCATWPGWNNQPVRPEPEEEVMATPSTASR